MLKLLSRLLGPLRRERGERPPETPLRWVDLRISGPLFATVRRHVEDFSRGEEAGFLVCSASRLDAADVLLAR
jgi:hypothetical protein